MSTQDTTPPTLTSLSLTNVNVQDHDRVATFSAGAMDVGLGVENVQLTLDHSIQSNGMATKYLTFYNFGSSNTATLSQQIDSTTARGLYNVTDAYVTDKAGNLTHYSAADLKGLGIDDQFRVRSNAMATSVSHTDSVGQGNELDYATIYSHEDAHASVIYHHWL